MSLFKASAISIFVIAVLNFIWGALAGDPAIQAGFYMAIVATVSCTVFHLLVVGLSLLFFGVTRRTRNLKSSIATFIILFLGICLMLPAIQYLTSGRTDLFEDGIVYFLPSALVFSIFTPYLEFKICRPTEKLEKTTYGNAGGTNEM